MKLDQLQHVMAIVEHGSLRAAARRLDVPQPALTRSVRSLERELGGAVFVRQTTGMTLTQMGQRLHVRAVAIVNEARRARDEVSQTLGDDEGTVVVGLSIMPHLGMLPQALPAFRRRYPKVRLQVIEGLFPDLESGVRDGSVDFYLGAAPHLSIAPGLVARHLFDNTRAIICRRGHPLASSRALKSLADANWATTSVDYNVEGDLHRLFASHGLAAPRVLLQVRSAMSLMIGLAYSDLLAIVPVQWNSFALTRDVLQIIRVREPLPSPAMVLIKKPSLPLTPAAEFLCDMLLRQAPSSHESRREGKGK